MGVYKGRIVGKIISKEERIGTRSAGPEYYLKAEGNYSHWGDIHLRKKTLIWQSDPILHKFIGKQVEIYAEIIETKDKITIEYIEIKKIS